MKKFNLSLLLTVLAVFFVCGLSRPITVRAATTPSLGTAASFSVLAHTFTSTVIPYGASIFGDSGYATSTGVAVYVSGATHVNDATYTQAGADQLTALTALNSQACDFTFPAGPVDLATDTSHTTYGGALGVYTPGVYCSSGAMSIGGGGTIMFDGAGTYIFRPTGMLTTSDNSIATTTNGASACDIFWTPKIPVPADTVLGLNTKFVGTVIEPLGPVNSDITVGGGTHWLGRALAYNWNVITNPVIMKYVNITAPTCAAPPPPPPSHTATLHVIKTVINDNGGTAIASEAIIHVTNGLGNVAGSPQTGVGSPGTSYTLNADTYTVSEDEFAGYTATYGGDCDSSGHITLASGDNKTCTVTNNDDSVPPPHNAFLHVIKSVINDNGGTAVASSFTLHVKLSGTDIAGSPAAGVSTPGIRYAPAFTSAPFQRTYIISEDAMTGYTPSFGSDCPNGEVILMAGDDKTCTIINNDNPPSSHQAILHVIKHVINDDGSKEIASDFTLHVKGSGGMGLNEVSGSPAAGVETPGTSYTLDAGTYAVSEDVQTGYTSSFSGDCDSSGHVTLASGDNKTCTITNDDVAIPPPPPSSHQATLHVIKVVINDNGGKAIVSEATIHVMSSLGDVSGSPHSGVSSPGTAYSLDAGTYTVSEDFFPGYTVKISGDCNDSGTVVLASGDEKTCTITNNDIKGIIIPPVIITTTTPPVVNPPACDICQRLTYDIYIINPDGSQRHTGTPWVKVTDRGNGVLRYSFEDATLDPKNPLYDHNDSVVDIDLKDCKSVKFMFVSSDASWKHQVRVKVSIDGVAQSDTLVVNDSKSVVGTSKTINATTGTNTKLACSQGSTPVGLKGKILLQVQAHGEAWYINPKDGKRYYMANGEKAYAAMRNFGVGITNKNLDKIKIDKTLAKKSSGKIFLQVELHGEAYYIDFNGVAHYLKNGAAAYEIMRSLGLGITTVNLNKISVGE